MSSNMDKNQRVVLCDAETQAGHGDGEKLENQLVLKSIEARLGMQHYDDILPCSSTIYVPDRQIRITEAPIHNHVSAEEIAQFQLRDLRPLFSSRMWSTEAKLLIFSAAANSQQYRDLLVPTPPHFMQETGYNIELLRSIVGNWPSCKQMQHELYHSWLKTETDSVQLLHWLLVQRSQPQMRRLAIIDSRGLCLSLGLKPPLKSPKHMLRICNDGAQCRFGNMPKPRYAYFGCHISLLYRFLSLERFDEPDATAGTILLHEQAEVAIQNSITQGNWHHSRFGRSPIFLVICELLALSKEHATLQSALKPQQQQQQQSEQNQLEQSPVEHQKEEPQREQQEQLQLVDGVIILNSNYVKPRYMFVYTTQPMQRVPSNHSIASDHRHSMFGDSCVMVVVFKFAWLMLKRAKRLVFC